MKRRIKWQPIESAPKAGKAPVYVTFYAGGCWRIGYVAYTQGGWLSKEFGIVMPHSWLDIRSI